MGEYNLTAYLAMQKKEIEEHKYHLSERAGCDVGYEATMRDWIQNHAERFHDNFFEHLDAINKICRENCGDDCRGIEGCVLSNDIVHRLLGD